MKKNISNLFEYYRTRERENEYLKDIYNGQVWKELIESEYMNEAHLKIGLGFCFDGMDIFKKGRSKGSISSIEFSILNFPPEYRHIAAFGIQLAILFNDTESSSPAMDGIMELLVDEMLELYNGFTYVDHNNNTKLCRGVVIYVATDTKGHEKLFKVSGSNSKIGLIHI